MKQEVLDKIKDILALAQKGGSGIAERASSVLRNNDGLLKAIRNKREADYFLSELDAVINSATKSCKRRSA